MNAAQTISRAQMVDVMSQHMSADVTERVGHNWKRVNAMVADQGSGAAKLPSLDFHLIELYLSGTHFAKVEGDMLDGDKWDSQYLPGQVSYLQDGCEYDLQCDGQAKIQHIYLDSSIFTECADVLFKGDPDGLARHGFQGVFDPSLKSLSEKLLEEARRPNIGSDLNADLIANQMAVNILRHQNCERIVEKPVRALSPEETAVVISYLEDQIEDIGGMDTVAGLINMDVFTFTRAFKASTGQTPGQFLIERRIARVKDLLLHSSDTLSDITYATGFASQAHMTSTFGKHVGISPGRWRKATRE